MNAPGIEQQIGTIVEDLTKEFAASHSPTQVQAVIDRWRADIEPSAKIKDFIPVLVRRYSREELVLGLQPARAAG